MARTRLMTRRQAAAGAHKRLTALSLLSAWQRRARWRAAAYLCSSARARPARRRICTPACNSCTLAEALARAAQARALALVRRRLAA
eukprot:scaffold58479_cov29-Phaeocystis_antarctica.AAC.2